MEDQRVCGRRKENKGTEEVKSEEERVEKNKRCQYSVCKNSYSYPLLSQQLIKYAFEFTRLRMCVCVCVCLSR